MGTWGKQQALANKRHEQNERRGVLMLLAFVVVLATAAALMLPAISATKSDLENAGVADVSNTVVQAESEEAAGSDGADAVEAVQEETPAPEAAPEPEPEPEPAAQEPVPAPDPAADAADPATTEEPAPATSEDPALADDPEVVDPEVAAAMPAQNFYDALKTKDKDGKEYIDLAVYVEAPAGALPAGTTMKLDRVKAEDIQGSIDKAVKDAKGDKASAAIANAVSITFTDADGNLIEPAKKVNVKISASEVPTIDKPVLVRVTNEQVEGKSALQQVAKLLKKAQLVNWEDTDKSTGNENTLQAQLKKFGAFAILKVEVQSDEESSLVDEAATQDATEEAPEPEPETADESEKTVITTPERPAQQFSEQLKDDADNVTLVVNVDAPEGALPEGATMKLEPVTKESVLDAAKDKAAAETEIEASRAQAVAVDITFYDADGEPIEPAADVHVSLSAPSAAIAKDELAVVHLPENEAAEVVATTATDPATATAEFDSANFSVYALVYTVDFTWEVDGKTYEFSLIGGSVASFRELAEALHLAETATGNNDANANSVDDFLADVANITFSDDSLVRALPITEGISAAGLKQKYDLEAEFSAELSDTRKAALDAKVFYAPDWALVSLKPFKSEETLTITMADGEVFTIAVSDAQITQEVLTANRETYTITVTYGVEAGIPEGATLSVREIETGTDEYTQYLESSAQQLGVENTGDVPFARFFDIGIADKDGQKVEPLSSVDVRIELKDATNVATDSTKVLHFAEKTTEVIEPSPDSKDALQFAADSFSVYGVITVPTAQPDPEVTDLDGQSFTISHDSRYVTTSITPIENNNNTNGFGKTGSASGAATWFFERPDGSSGNTYYIYTMVDGQKRYMNLTKNNNNQDRANASLSGTPQSFTVTKEGNNYRLATQSNGTTYYLDEHNGNSGNAFAGWHGATTNGLLTLNFAKQPVMQNGNPYMTLVKYNGEYYIVNNDATLTKVDYDEATKTVAVDDPMLWTVEDGHIYFNSREAGFNEQQTASDWYRRYLDPSSEGAYLEETNEQGPGHVDIDAGSQHYANGIWYWEHHITIRNSVWNNTSVAIDSIGSGDAYNIHHGNNYLGVVADEDGNLYLTGQKGSGEAAEFVFASPTGVKGVYWTNHTVNHIDISIAGSAKVSVPLAYGKYYGPAGDGADPILTITDNTKLELSEEQMVDRDQLRITAEDMKRASIVATRADNGATIDDAFYITGYSGNVANGASNDQVRIEGSFMAADLRGTDYEYVDWNTYDPWGNSNQYTRDVMAARKANTVEYTVTVVKPLTYKLIDPEIGQLYDEDGNELTVTVDVAFSASFNYWDSANECPAVRWAATDGEQAWRNGNIDRSNLSGMDFVLGGDADNPDSPLVALEITKVIMDEEGNRIHLSEPVTTYFDVYEKKNASNIEKNGVQGLHVVDSLHHPEWQADPRDATINNGYQYWRTKRVKVDDTGSSIVFDFDATDAMYYIEEKHDEESLPQTVTDKHGEEWTYAKTYIETEYVRRDDEAGTHDEYSNKTLHPQAMHITEDFTRANGSYKSIPEVAGKFTKLDGVQKKEGLLEFYVYNIYTQGTKLDVEKKWQPEGKMPPDGAEATMELQFRMRKIGTMQSGVENLLPESQFGEWWPVADWQDALTPIPVKDGERTDWALVKDNQGEGKVFGSDVETTLTLTASESANRNWKGSFKGLPKTWVDDQGNVYELDYSAKETSVKVPGEGGMIDVSDQYKVTVTKEEPSAADVGISDGKTTITNDKGDLVFEKRWLDSAGAETTPNSAAVITAELWRAKSVTVDVTDELVPVTIIGKANKYNNGNPVTLWTGAVRSGSDLRFSVAVNGTSNPANYGGIVTNNGTSVVRESATQDITYEKVDPSATATIHKPQANVFKLSEITSATEVTADFGDADANASSGIGYYIVEQDTTPNVIGQRTDLDSAKVPIEGNQDGNVILNVDNNWRFALTAEQMDSGWLYYIKPDTITELGLSEDKYVFTPASAPAYDENGNMVYTNTNQENPGALTITKAVTVNGGDVPSDDNTIADGDYAFTITGPSGYSHTGTITVTNGVAQSSIALTGLVSGQYTIEETGSTNPNITLAESQTVTVAAGSEVSPQVAAFTNNLDTMQLTVNKTWADGANKHTSDSIEYTLYRIPKADEDEYDPERVTSATGFTGRLSANNSWTETVTNLPKDGKYTPAGGSPVDVTYTYYVSEGDFPNYSSVPSGGVGDDGKYSFTITNTPYGSFDDTTEVNIAKDWKDAAGQSVTGGTTHDNDTITVQLTQKKYQAKYRSGSSTSELYPVKINLYNGNGGLSDLSRVVYVPFGGTLKINPKSNSSGTVVGSGFEFGNDVERQAGQYTFQRQVSTARTVTLTLKKSSDTWGTSQNSTTWVAAISSGSSARPVIEESELLANLDTSGDPIATTQFNYSMALDEVKNNTVLTKLEGAQGTTSGTGKWSGKVSELPFFKKEGYNYYVYTYEVSEIKIGEVPVQAIAEQHEDFTHETPKYYVKWAGDGDSWTITNQAKPQIDLNIRKIEKDDVATANPDTELLKGATFKLQKYTNDTYMGLDTLWGTQGEIEIADTANTGIFSFTALPFGYYKLIESHSPAGYTKAEDVLLQVKNDNGAVSIVLMTKVEGTEHATELEATVTETLNLVNSPTAASTLYFGNEPGKPLPNTGGIGAEMLTIFGIMLVAIAGAVFVLGRRRPYLGVSSIAQIYETIGGRR